MRWGVCLCPQVLSPSDVAYLASRPLLSFPLPLMAAGRGSGRAGGEPLATCPVGPQIRRDHPLNLSISISGGRETNQDSLSSGE